MKVFKYKFVLGLIVCLISIGVTTNSYADIKKVAQTGFQFLKIDMHPRAAAMGGAFTMVSQGAASTFYNPGALGHMNSTADGLVMRNNWIAGIGYSAGALALNLDNLGVVGLNVISADYGEINGYRVANNQQGYESTGQVDVGAYAVGLSYARAFTNKFSFGLQVKYASQNLGQNTMKDGDVVKNEESGFAFDMGTVFYPGFTPTMRIGISIRNFSEQFQYYENEFELPITFRIGFAVDAFDFVPWNNTNSSWLFSVDALHPRDYTERVHLGTEYWFMDTIALRGGYKTNYDEEGLSAGFGVKYSIADIAFKVDYSYSDFGRFNGVNRVAIGAEF